ncbi:MAG: hypothetical protein RBT80_08020 [Candidatus Vecturithrix sp.]|jgi:hypothetical protein|nr:hypothetical protein [Candidatus Vecturithrix sp.]
MKSKNRCLKAFIIASILIMSLGFLKTYLLQKFTQNSLDAEVFWILKTFAKPKFDMILMGDSRVYRGLSPEAMNTILPGYQILNFGYAAGGLNTTIYKEAEFKFDPKSNKKTIVLGVTPMSLLPGSEKNSDFEDKKSNSREYVFMIKNFSSFITFFNPFNFEELLPPQLKKFMQTLLKKPYSGNYYQIYHKNGWVASWRVPEDPQQYLVSFQQVFSHNKVSDKLIQDLLQQTIKWRQQGIQVFGFRPPSSKAMEELENELSGFDEATFSQQFKTAGGIWFSFPTEKYHSYDASHLHKDSAIQLSLDLAQRIKEHIDIYAAANEPQG